MFGLDERCLLCVDAEDADFVHHWELRYDEDSAAREVYPHECEVPTRRVSGYHEEDDREYGEEFARACELDLIIDLLPERHLRVLSVIVGERRAFDPVEEDEGHDTVHPVHECPRDLARDTDTGEDDAEHDNEADVEHPRDRVVDEGDVLVQNGGERWTLLHSDFDCFEWSCGW